MDTNIIQPIIDEVVKRMREYEGSNRKIKRIIFLPNYSAASEKAGSLVVQYESLPKSATE